MTKFAIGPLLIGLAVATVVWLLWPPGFLRRLPILEGLCSPSSAGSS
jgi:hypothetical protein